MLIALAANASWLAQACPADNDAPMLTPEDLNHIAARTVGHYDQRAHDYW